MVGVIAGVGNGELAEVLRADVGCGSEVGAFAVDPVAGGKGAAV